MTTSVGPVVVGTDFSDGSAAALLEARALASRLGTRVDVVHVVDGTTDPGWEEPGAAAQWLASAGLQVGDLVVRFGRAWVELVRYAAEVGPSLLVVGSHGTSGYQPLELGGTASRLSLQARCPVAIISTRAAVEAQNTRTTVAARADAAAMARAEAGDQQLRAGDRR
jgi:nucleotide-binding universal stress UspA family protein